MEKQLKVLPTRDVAALSWGANGRITVADNPDEAIAISDDYAPEHLELHVKDRPYFFDRLRNYGSLFIGEETTVAYGDKSIGTNHILPTSRSARYTGGLWVGKFLKTVTYQRMTPRRQPADRRSHRAPVPGGADAGPCPDRPCPGRTVQGGMNLLVIRDEQLAEFLTSYREEIFALGVRTTDGGRESGFPRSEPPETRSSGTQGFVIEVTSRAPLLPTMRLSWPLRAEPDFS